MRHLLWLLILCLAAPLHALVAGYIPNPKQIDLLSLGTVADVVTSDTQDVTIQICTVIVDAPRYDRKNREHTERITLIYNVGTKNTESTMGISQADKVMVWNHRKPLVTGESYLFPLKWSPELLAYICYDKWDGVWETTEAGREKVDTAVTVLEAKP